ncbi:MAG: carboxypeptidase-like regulatory domain-containing protein [Nitrospirota bacterium]
MVKVKEVMAKSVFTVSKKRKSKRQRWVWGTLPILILLASPVFATHEIDHRFIVHGTIRDDRGNPVANAKVIVVAPRLDEGMTAFADRNGDFEALLHLHNTDLGDEIIVTALDQKKTIRAEFDPNDKVTIRKARVDFGAPTAKNDGKGFLENGAVMGTAMLVGAVVVFALYRRYGKRKHPATPKARGKGR